MGMGTYLGRLFNLVECNVDETKPNLKPNWSSIFWEVSGKYLHWNHLAALSNPTHKKTTRTEGSFQNQEPNNTGF